MKSENVEKWECQPGPVKEQKLNSKIIETQTNWNNITKQHLKCDGMWFDDGDGMRTIRETKGRELEWRRKRENRRKRRGGEKEKKEKRKTKRSGKNKGKNGKIRLREKKVWKKMKKKDMKREK